MPSAVGVATGEQSCCYEAKTATTNTANRVKDKHEGLKNKPHSFVCLDIADICVILCPGCC